MQLITLTVEVIDSILDDLQLFQDMHHQVEKLVLLQLNVLEEGDNYNIVLRR
jgi:hypothetical protein